MQPICFLQKFCTTLLVRTGDSIVPKAEDKADPGALHNLDGVEGRHAVPPVVTARALANF